MCRHYNLNGSKSAKIHSVDVLWKYICGQNCNVNIRTVFQFVNNGLLLI